MESKDQEKCAEKELSGPVTLPKNKDESQQNHPNSRG
jgi:hypothetical protein